MVLRIGRFFQLPKREVNRALHQAGFTPEFVDLGLEHEDLRLVNQAIGTMLENHMPYPALVLDRNWDIVDANQTALSLVKLLGFTQSNNLVEGFIADAPETSKIVNWYESARVVLRRLQYEIGISAQVPSRLCELEQRLRAKLGTEASGEVSDDNRVVVSTFFRFGDLELSYFSVVAQLGTVQDVNVSELKVELMFPADDATTEFHQVSCL